MNSKLFIILCLGLAGCQQKSEIDKCVEALVVQQCVDADNKRKCISDMRDVLGGDLRLHCLKAQSGKE
jgi:hypothetical protein